MQITRYEPKYAAEWNAFVSIATNGTFLFDRTYLAHHADRFTDHSLLVRDAKGHLMAVLPANQLDAELHSHQGLTYGGLVVRSPHMVQLAAFFNHLNAYCQEQGIGRLVYKPVPYIYAAAPAQDDLYCLFRLGAVLEGRNVATVVDQGRPLPFTELRRRGVAKALKYALRVGPTTDYTAFWQLLQGNVAQKYGAVLPHSLADITKLASAFPDKIKLWIAIDGVDMRAGVVIYETDEVARAQYIAASAEGQRQGALDLLFAFLLREAYAHKAYFDFGTSNERQGHLLNNQLIFQKEGFGGRGVVFDTYAYATSARIEV